MEHDVNLRTYWFLLNRRKGIILAIALLVGLFAAGLAFVNQPEPLFESTATVKIERSSTTTGIYLETISWSEADYLATQVSIITSYPMVERAAVELGLLAGDLDPTRIRSDRNLIAIVLELKDRLRAEREGNSNLVNITATAAEPETAQRIANTLARVYSDAHSAEVNKRTSDARRFIEEQLRQVGEKLRQAEEALLRFREENRLLIPDSQTATLLGQLAQAETEFQRLTRQTGAIDQAMAALAKARTATPATSGFTVDGAPPLYESLNGKLVDLILERDALLLNYTAEHPLVQDSSGRIAELIGNMTTTLRDQRRFLEQNLAATTTRLEEYRRQLAVLPGQGLTLERLQRDLRLNQEINTLLQTKLQEARIMEAAKIQEVTIVKPALEPMAPLTRVNVAGKGAAGLAVGLLLGLLAAILLEYLDTSMATAEQAEKFTGIRVLATIPALTARPLAAKAAALKPDGKLTQELFRRIGHLVTHYLPASAAAESYREVMAALRFAALDGKSRVIAFTSAVANEGKTTAILNTAIALAQSQSRVLVVEADLRQPILAKWLGLEPRPGLTDLLLGAAERQKAVRTVTDLILGAMDIEEVTLTPGLDNLFILPCGTKPGNPTELLFSHGFRELLEEASHGYDMVLVDLPPVLAGADTAIISSHVHGVVLVFKAGRTERQMVQRALAQLKKARANIMGIVVNASTSSQRQPAQLQSYLAPEAGYSSAKAATLAALAKSPLVRVLALAAGFSLLAFGLYLSLQGGTG
ncbi:MAG: AAA family ATPase [Thermodesulfobacteriota bacterium]